VINFFKIKPDKHFSFKIAGYANKKGIIDAELIADNENMIFLHRKSPTAETKLIVVGKTANERQRFLRDSENMKICKTFLGNDHLTDEDILEKATFVSMPDMVQNMPNENTQAEEENYRKHVKINDEVIKNIQAEGTIMISSYKLKNNTLMLHLISTYFNNIVNLRHISVSKPNY